MGILCIQHWQMERFEEVVKGRLRSWTYSPSGVGKINCWVLMHYSESEKCSAGDWHPIKRWDFMHEQMMNRMGKKKNSFEPPEMSKKLDKEFYKRVKNIKKSDPWPGRD